MKCNHNLTTLSPSHPLVDKIPEGDVPKLSLGSDITDFFLLFYFYFTSIFPKLFIITTINFFFLTQKITSFQRQSITQIGGKIDRLIISYKMSAPGSCVLPVACLCPHICLLWFIFGYNNLFPPCRWSISTDSARHLLWPMECERT